MSQRPYGVLKNWRTLLGVIALLVAVAILAQPTAGRPLFGTPGKGSSAPTGQQGPVVGTAQKADVSPPLRTIRPIAPRPVPDRERDENLNPALSGLNQGIGVKDSVVQKLASPFGALLMPTPIV